jgi:hypothetical protein
VHSRQVRRVTQNERARKQHADRNDRFDVDVPCHRNPVEPVHQVGCCAEKAGTKSLYLLVRVGFVVNHHATHCTSEMVRGTEG